MSLEMSSSSLLSCESLINEPNKTLSSSSAQDSSSYANITECVLSFEQFVFPTPSNSSNISRELFSALDNLTSNAYAHAVNGSDIGNLTTDYNSYYNSTSIESDNNETLTLEDSNAFILPIWQQVVWYLIFGAMVVTATGGNVIVMWIVISTRKMRTVTNFFIVNLSIADTMVSTLNVIFNFIYMLNGDWPYGDAYCRISNFIAIVSVGASVTTLVAIALDRHTAIMHPLRPRMSRSRALTIMSTIWFLSAALSSPNLYFSKVKYENYSSGEYRTICYIHWPDGPSTVSYMDYIYNVIILLVTYVLPIALMTATYFRVGLKLWGSRSIGEITPKQISNIKSKRKIVKMMVVVVVIFTVCWLPYHVYFLLLHHNPEIISSDNVQHIYLAIYWLAMSNAMYNPLIYCWMNNRFRRGFKNVFLCTCSTEDIDEPGNVSTAGASGAQNNRNRRRRFEFSDVTPFDTSTDQSLGQNRVRGSNANSLSIETCLELSNASSRKASPRSTPARKSNTLMV